MVLDLRTTTLQKCDAVPRRADISGSQICMSLNSRLESDEERRQKQCPLRGLRRFRWGRPLGGYVTKFASHEASELIA